MTHEHGQTLGVSCDSSVPDLYFMSMCTPDLLAPVLALLDSDTLSLSVFDCAQPNKEALQQEGGKVGMTTGTPHSAPRVSLIVL